MGPQQWQQTETVAWTMHDGPGRAPSGPPRRMLACLAAGLGTVFIGMMTSDALCPEHRAWVQVMAGAAFVGTAVSVVGLLRRWTLAPMVTALVCALGVGIGLVDAIHAPARGMILAAVFSALTLVCVVASVMMVRLAVWDRAVARSLRPEPANDILIAQAPASEAPMAGTCSPEVPRTGAPITADPRLDA